MKRTRLLSVIMAGVLLVSGLAACGNQTGGSSSPSDNGAVEGSEVPGGADDQSGNGSNGGDDSRLGDNSGSGLNDNSDDKSQTQADNPMNRPGEIRDLTPAELIAEMKTGWNLGNSLDATGAIGIMAETSWGNPKTTQEMIDEVHAKGFDVIRIPVTWYGHFSAPPDYTIQEIWMDRVQEVVNYAIDDGMYVILDSHHEEEWRIPDNEHIDAVSDEVYKLWVQIAERFRDYGDHLIFDGLNEPRVKGGTNEWNGGTEEGRRCLDRLNQSFIDAVRSTGGNNEKRLLLVTTFASASAKETMSDVAIPEDDHIAFSIHSYTPYAFTYRVDESWEIFEWNGSNEGDIDYVFSEMKKSFLDKGIPVIVTEYGAVHKNEDNAETVKWVTYYLETAKSYGIPCVWWDNNCYTTNTEDFGLFNRREGTWYAEDVVDAIMDVYE